MFNFQSFAKSSNKKALRSTFSLLFFSSNFSETKQTVMFLCVYFCCSIFSWYFTEHLNFFFLFWTVWGNIYHYLLRWVWVTGSFTQWQWLIMEGMWRKPSRSLWATIQRKILPMRSVGIRSWSGPRSLLRSYQSNSQIWERVVYIGVKEANWRAPSSRFLGSWHLAWPIMRVGHCLWIVIFCTWQTLRNWRTWSMINTQLCVFSMTMPQKRRQKWMGQCRQCIQGRIGLPWCCTIAGIQRTRSWRLRLWIRNRVPIFIGFSGLRMRKLDQSHLFGISSRAITR